MIVEDLNPGVLGMPRLNFALNASCQDEPSLPSSLVELTPDVLGVDDPIVRG